MAPEVVTRVAFQNILFPTDFSEASQRALPYALAFARRYDARFTLMHVAPPEAQAPIPMEPVQLDNDWQMEHARESLRHLEALESLQVYPHSTVLKQGNAWREIEDFLHERSIDLIVLGTHGRGALGTLMLGSVAEQILRHAPCPVLTIGPEVVPSLADREKLAHVLFATDFSAPSLQALPYALALAEENDAELTLFHVLDQIEPLPAHYTKQLLADCRERLWHLVPEAANLWCTPKIAVAVGSVSAEIVRLAHDRQVELVVMGAHAGPVGVSHLPWTVLHEVVRHARCPVLTVRDASATAT